MLAVLSSASRSSKAADLFMSPPSHASRLSIAMSVEASIPLVNRRLRSRRVCISDAE